MDDPIEYLPPAPSPFFAPKAAWCGTDAARRHHLTHGQSCRACWDTIDGLPDELPHRPLAGAA